MIFVDSYFLLFIILCALKILDLIYSENKLSSANRTIVLAIFAAVAAKWENRLQRISDARRGAKPFDRCGAIDAIPLKSDLSRYVSLSWLFRCKIIAAVDTLPIDTTISSAPFNEVKLCLKMSIIIEPSNAIYRGLARTSSWSVKLALIANKLSRRRWRSRQLLLGHFGRPSILST